MCHPIVLAVATFAVGAASGLSDHYGQVANAEYMNQLSDLNTRNAQAALVAQYGHTQNRIEQERSAVVHDKFENQIEAMQARGTAVTSAGEAGVGGLSVEALLRDYYRREGRYNLSVDSNFQMTRSYLQAEMDSQRAQAQNQINAMPKVAKPSFLDAGLRIAGAGLDAATGYYTMTRGR